MRLPRTICAACGAIVLLAAACPRPALAERLSTAARVERCIAVLHEPTDVWISHIWFVPGNAQRRAIDDLVHIGGPAVEPLIAALLDPKPEVRYQSTEALGRIRNRSSVGPLIRVFQSDDQWEVRAGAADALAKLKDPRALPPLLTAMDTGADDPHFYVVYALAAFPTADTAQVLSGLLKRAPPPYLLNRRDIGEDAAISLAEMGPRGWKMLELATIDRDPTVRRHAAIGLLCSKDLAGRKLVAALLRDPDSGVREETVFCIGTRKARWAVRFLIETLRQEVSARSDGAYVAAGSANSLGKLGDRRAVPALIEALSAENLQTQLNAAEALGSLRDRRAVPTLISLLESSEVLLRSPAAEALSHIGDRRALEPLLRVAGRPSALARPASLRALGPLRDSRAFRLLLDALSDTEPLARIAAAEGLGRQGDRAAIPALIRALEDPEEEVRKNAARSLGQLHAREAVEPLRRMIQRDSRSYPVYSVAQQALRKIGVKP